MQDADWEEQSSSDQESPKAHRKACKHMGKPCKEAHDADKPTHYRILTKEGVRGVDSRGLSQRPEGGVQPV